LSARSFDLPGTSAGGASSLSSPAFCLRAAAAAAAAVGGCLGLVRCSSSGRGERCSRSHASRYLRCGLARTGLTPARICARTGLNPAHICTGTGLTAAHICAGTGPSPGAGVGRNGATRGLADRTAMPRTPRKVPAAPPDGRLREVTLGYSRVPQSTGPRSAAGRKVTRAAECVRLRCGQCCRTRSPGAGTCGRTGSAARTAQARCASAPSPGCGRSEPSPGADVAFFRVVPRKSPIGHPLEGKPWAVSGARPRRRIAVDVREGSVG